MEHPAMYHARGIYHGHGTTDASSDPPSRAPSREGIRSSSPGPLSSSRLEHLRQTARRRSRQCGCKLRGLEIRYRSQTVGRGSARPPGSPSIASHSTSTSSSAAFFKLCHPRGGSCFPSYFRFGGRTGPTIRSEACAKCWNRGYGFGRISSFSWIRLGKIQLGAVNPFTTRVGDTE